MDSVHETAYGFARSKLGNSDFPVRGRWVQMDVVKRICAEDLAEAIGLRGVRGWPAVAYAGFWAGIVTTDPDWASAWHHHCDQHKVIYLLEGRMTIEWGTGVGQSIQATAGEFLHVPPNTVHREVNPDPSAIRAVVIRVGEGDAAVEVPAPA